MGALHNTSGRFKDAVSLFEESYMIEEKIGNQKEMAVCLNNLGNSHILLHEWERADAFFMKAQDIALTMKDIRELGNIYTNRGVLFMYQENYDAARDLLLNAVKSYTPINETKGLYSAYYNLGLIFLKDGDRDQSMNYFAKALDQAKDLDLKIYGEAAFNIGKFLFKLLKKY